ncbi:protein kinase [Streptomyces kaniharaensis]|uniref:Protein kinase n=1 Tax=Streptomyces kaniharaensis TaxID=212423 RepID=A0A6N7KQ35_9ACTN|nr:serine/threonine-protein kinase [Streptomyces kaniharaensis]MQS13630.1 protein kinase [Streptomyces kaniharaensis]
MQSLGPDDPRRIGAYRLLRRLGAGGMGRVYLGRTAGGRTVAVKVVRDELADDAEFRARFRQEVAAARRVGGDWTAPVLDADTEGEHPWVATGYVAGPALGTAVHDFGPLPEPAVRTLGIGLAEALAHVHGLGLVHRDVKPSNVLLTLDGPRLIDFGIARALDAASGFTQSGYVVGSPGFMSPEQANGQSVGPAGDVFSLGAVLAFAATGLHPFGEGVSAAVLLYRVLHEEPDVRGLTGQLREIVLDCLAKDPAARPTPQQLRTRLDPDGTASARLRHGGWLPSALAAAVGRSAVELLDLEGEAPDPVVSDPVPSSSVSSAPSASSAPASPRVERTPTVVPSAPSASSTTGSPRGRARLATGVVLALLALGGGGYGTYRWMQQPDPVVTASGSSSPTVSGGGSGSTEPQAPPSSGAPSSGAPTSGAPMSSGSASPAPDEVTGAPSGPSVVPSAFLGVWRGDMVTEKGLPAGTTTLTIGPAAIGQENTTSRNAVSGLISLSCEGAWKLRSASATKLVFESRLVRSTLPGACSGGSYTETLTLQNDGTIRFTSADPVAGNPAGTMRKADGAAG